MDIRSNLKVCPENEIKVGSLLDLSQKGYSQQEL
jgi:hypothetical protein